MKDFGYNYLSLYCEKSTWNNVIATTITNPGRTFRFPVGILPHPVTADFVAPRFSEWQEGQVATWKLPIMNGRVHIRLFKNGIFEVHFDRYDPDSGLTNLLNHILAETPLGPLMMMGLFGIALRG